MLTAVSSPAHLHFWELLARSMDGKVPYHNYMIQGNFEFVAVYNN